MVGLALIINGLVVSKKMVEIQERLEREAKPLEEGATPRACDLPTHHSSFRLA